nr:hypothetical protein [Tanacetum cinerariifolium]
KFCGNGAHVGYNCPAQVPSVQTMPSFPQQSPCCEDSGLNSTLAKITEQMTSITSLCEMACNFVQKKLEEKQLEEEQAAKAQT